MHSLAIENLMYKVRQNVHSGDSAVVEHRQACTSNNLVFNESNELLLEITRGKTTSVIRT